MLNNNIITPFNINQVVKRKFITFGNVFSYNNGTNTRYGAIAYHDNYMYAFKLRRNNEGNEVAVSSCCSPLSSKVSESECTIRGFYALRINFYAIPSIKSATKEDRPAFASVVSLPTSVDKKGRSHLFLYLGIAPLNDIGKGKVSLMSLTNDADDFIPAGSTFAEISYAPLDGMMAIRGMAELEITEQKGES